MKGKCQQIRLSHNIKTELLPHFRFCVYESHFIKVKQNIDNVILGNTIPQKNPHNTILTVTQIECIIMLWE